jgi:hypothetical protein
MVITDKELWKELKRVNLCLFPFYIKRGVNCHQLVEYYVDTMNHQEDYKELFFNLCEEKQQLDLDNHRLKKDSEYWRRQTEKFERMYKEQYMKQK